MTATTINFPDTGIGLDSTSSKRDAGTATIFAIAACVVLPLVFLFSTGSSYPAAGALITCGLLLYSGAHLTTLIYRGEKRPLQGVFWLFAYITMGVAPFAQVITGEHQLLASASQTIWAYAVVFVGFLSYDLGSAIAKRRDVTVFKRDRIAPTKHSVRRVLNVWRLQLFSVATVAITVYNVSQRGLASYFTSRQENAAVFNEIAGDADGQATRAVLSALDAVPQLIVLIAWLLVLFQQRTNLGRSMLSTKLWVLVFLGINVVINNPLTNSRFWVLTVGIAVLFAIPWVRGSVYRVILIGGAAAAVLVFPLSDVFRLSAQYRAQYGFESRGVIENLAIKDYDQMVMIANGLWYVESSDFHFGGQMLGNLLFWVPRSIWPSKPIDTGIEIGTAMNAVNVNLSSPLWIELYVDAGIIGVIIGFSVIGYWSRRSDTRFFRQTAHMPVGISVTNVVVPLVAGYQFILLRGPLLQSMGRLAVMAIIVWFLFSAARSPRQTADRAQRPSKAVRGT